MANGEKSPTAIDLQRELNALKETELPWMHEVSKCAPQEALRGLDKAFANFFRRVKQKKAGRRMSKLASRASSPKRMAWAGFA